MRRSTLLKHFTALIILSASLFILDETKIFTSVSAFFGNSLIQPTLSQSRYSLHSVTNFFASILSIRTLMNQSVATEKERDYYRGEYIRLKQVSEENELLRQALQIDSESQHLHLAQVVSFNVLLPKDFMLISKGLSSGISVGDAVITENRVLVGIVTKAEEKQSTVRLISSESSNIPALLSSTGTHVSLRGSATGALNLDLIPRDVEVFQGELVISSGVTGTIPSHLIMGDVQRIIDNETASFKRAVVRPLVEISELQTVFVITDF